MAYTARGCAGPGCALSNQRMQLLIEMTLSPRWIGVLAEAGIDATHWSPK